ncbi:ABC transporter ATP-binding protein [Salipaludibacillus sp. HK11]|uniref:ABC transporter ATP-binding protein n=1 Tax=Salipaludibacillus sp. HK11 TaxID=3394320 RepID=UPI0039FD7F2B
MIELKNLYYSYPSAHLQAINGINVSIKKGEIFGFLGPSGAGKSTLQKILIGVLKGYEGTVTVMNQEISNHTADFYEKLGIAFETPDFYQKFTARENLEFFLSFYKKREIDLEELMEKVGLDGKEDIRVSDYSKGMHMRLNICRALLHDPELIFLDEPTAGLDPVNVQKVKELIREKQNQGKTIILNTHNMHVADSLCDRVAFIVDGEINEVDAPAKLKASHQENKLSIVHGNSSNFKTDHFPLTGLAENTRFQEILRSNSIQKIETPEKTLEEVFIEVTGRSLQ